MSLFGPQNCLFTIVAARTMASAIDFERKTGEEAIRTMLVR